MKPISYLFTIVLIFFSCSQNNELNHSLITAATKGDLQLLKSSINNGANINVKSEIDGLTPIFLAVKYGHLEIINYLIENNAELGIISNNNNSLLEVAFAQNNDTIKNIIFSQFVKHNKFQGLIHLSFGSYSRCNNTILLEKRDKYFNTYGYLSCMKSKFIFKILNHQKIFELNKLLTDQLSLLNNFKQVKDGSITTGPINISLFIPFYNNINVKLSDQNLSTNTEYYHQLLNVEKTISDFLQFYYSDKDHDK